MADFFNTVDYLEPKCPKCGIKIEWEITTVWSEEKQTPVCKECGEPIDCSAPIKF